MIDLSQFSDAEIIGRTAAGENRSGGLPGMQSVINSIMNRAAKPGWWGSTPREVCLKPKQYDCWIPGTKDYDYTASAPASESSIASAIVLAHSALAGALPDLTSGACYYFARWMKVWPHWAQGHTPCATIAGQVFFNDID